jgi:hypothetical protein
MKSYLLFLLTALSAGAQTSTAVALANPGFEAPYQSVNGNGGKITGQTASGWTENSAWANATVQYAQETGNPHSGASCQKIVVVSAGTGEMQLLQTFQLHAGNIYTASTWMRGLPGTTAKLRVQQGSSPYAALLETDVALAADWQQVSIEGYITTSESATFMIAAGSPGTLWVDDAAFSYRPGTISPTPNLGLISPSFFGMHVANFLEGQFWNPGFEPPFHEVGVNNAISGVVAADWNDNSSWSAVTVTYSEDTDQPHGGSAAQKISALSVPSGGAVQLVQQIGVVPGAAYTLSAWLRGDTGARVNLVMQNANAPYNWYASTPASITGNWQQFSATGIVGDSGAVLLMIRADAPGVFSVDDAAFTDASGQAVSGGVPWPTAGFGTLRLWDSGTSWTALEPQKGVWNWAPLDTWVAAAAAHGVGDILLTLGQSPGWASSSPDTVNYVGAGAPAPPANIQDWRDYITAVAQRYKGRIRYYEIWNEPNDPTYYTGTVPQLAQLTQEAYQILKAADPGNTVVAPVPYTTGYLDQLLAAGVGSNVDILAYHIYTYTNPPEQAAQALANVRLVMAKYGLDKMPLWDTEGASGDTTTPLDTAAKYIARRYLTELAFGSIRYDWYTWGKASKFCVGTEQDDPRVLTPAAKAYGSLFGWLAGSTLTQAAIDDAGNWQIWLTRPDASTALVVWNPTGTAQLTLPPSFAARTSIDLFGSAKSVQSRTVTVTDSPVLLITPRTRLRR